MIAAGRQPVAETAEILGRDDVVGADHSAPRRVVLDARQAQPGGRIDNHKVEAQLVEAVVEQLRHHRRGAVERVFRLAAPEGLLTQTLIAALGDRHREQLAGRPHRLQKAVRGQIAADLTHLVAEHRIVFDPMPVAIDDWMVDFRTDLFRGHMRAHGCSPNKLRLDCAAGASAAPQAIGAERCTPRRAARHLRRVQHHRPVHDAPPARPECPCNLQARQRGPKNWDHVKNF